MHRRLWISSVITLLTAAGTPAVAAADDRTTTSEPLPLERLFDNRAVSDNARPGEADFDGAGNSLSSQDLHAAGWDPGRRLDLDSASLRWPHKQPGSPDNVRADGQQVQVRGSGNAISLLVAGTSSSGGPGGDVTGSGTVHYWDGTTSTYTLSAPDWRGGPLATKGVALPHVNTRSGGQLAEKAKLYAVTVPVERGRQISSLPCRRRRPGKDLHVFAASVRGRSRAGREAGRRAAPATRPGPMAGPDTAARGAHHRRRVADPHPAGEHVRRGARRIGHASVAVQGDGASGRGRPYRSASAAATGGHAGRCPRGQRPGRLPSTARHQSAGEHPPAGPVHAAPVHSEASQTSYVSESGSGDRTGDQEGGAFTGSLDVWPFLTGVDVTGGPGSVVTLGDSITDGVRSTDGANRRWPDVLSRRLHAQKEVPRYGVLNQGISANRVTSDRYPGDGVSTDTGGVSALHRLERDVLGQTNAHTVVVFEGINDIRWGASADEVIAGLQDHHPAGAGAWIPCPRRHPDAV